MELKECMKRLSEDDFGRQCHIIYRTYDNSGIFGDGVVVRFGEELPGFLREVAEELRENGVGPAIVKIGALECSLVDSEGADMAAFPSSWETVAPETGEDLLNGRDENICRYDVETMLDSRLDCLGLRFSDRDGDRYLQLWADIGMLEKLAKPALAAPRP